jgi:hypothetical protein
MNFSPTRFRYGSLGALVGSGLYIGVAGVIDLHARDMSIKAGLIVAAVSFFISFLWFEQIIDLMMPKNSQEKENHNE